MTILNLYHYHNVPVPCLKLSVTSLCQKHLAGSGSNHNTLLLLTIYVVVPVLWQGLEKTCHSNSQGLKRPSDLTHSLAVGLV